jgi:hypothetical protein
MLSHHLRVLVDPIVRVTMTGSARNKRLAPAGDPVVSMVAHAQFGRRQVARRGPFGPADVSRRPSREMEIDPQVGASQEGISSPEEPRSVLRVEAGALTGSDELVSVGQIALQRSMSQDLASLPAKGDRTSHEDSE